MYTVCAHGPVARHVIWLPTLIFRRINSAAIEKLLALHAFKRSFKFFKEKVRVFLHESEEGARIGKLECQ
jgi:hypothetical protein